MNTKKYCLVFLSLTFFTGLHASDASSTISSISYSDASSTKSSISYSEKFKQFLKVFNDERIYKATTATLIAQHKNENLRDGAMNEEHRQSIALWDRDSTLARDLDLTSYT